MKPTEMRFQRRYSDDSGVEFGIIVNAKEIRIEACNEISLPREELDWLIECLTAARDSVATAK